MFTERLQQNPGPDGYSLAVSPGCLCPSWSEGGIRKWKPMKSTDKFPTALKNAGVLPTGRSRKLLRQKPSVFLPSLTVGAAGCASRWETSPC